MVEVGTVIKGFPQQRKALIRGVEAKSDFSHLTLVAAVTFTPIDRPEGVFFFCFFFTTSVSECLCVRGLMIPKKEVNCTLEFTIYDIIGLHTRGRGSDS